MSRDAANPAATGLRKANAVEMPNPAIHQIRFLRRVVIDLNKGVDGTSSNAGVTTAALSGTSPSVRSRGSERRSEARRDVRSRSERPVE